MEREFGKARLYETLRDFLKDSAVLIGRGVREARGGAVGTFEERTGLGYSFTQ